MSSTSEAAAAVAGKESPEGAIIDPARPQAGFLAGFEAAVTGNRG